MARRLVRRSVSASLLALAGTLWTAGTVAAECMFIPPFPRADAAIRSAESVIIGDVVPASAGDLGLGSDGERQIGLLVTEVLRGPYAVGDLIDIQYLEPNWPWWKYRGGNGLAFPSCAYLWFEVQVGDTIALALGAVQPRQRLETDGQSWIQPRTVYNAMSKVRNPGRLAGIRRLAELPQTDMARPARSGTLPWPVASWTVVIAVASVASAGAWHRAGLKRGPPSSDTRALGG